MKRCFGSSFLMRVVATMVFALLVAGGVQAQEFKSTVKIVVPFAPGGTSDILARLIAPHLQKAIGQTVIVENKPGAGGNIGADYVAHAPKDGGTLLLLDVASLATSPSLYTLTYDPAKDLAPVSMIMFAPYILAVNPALPVDSLSSLVAYGKANPGKLKVAHSGIGAGNHLTEIVLGKELGIDWKVVAYKGGADACRAAVANESNVILNGATATQPFVVQNQLRPIAVSGDKRLPTLKDIPTFAELKLPASDGGSWQGLLTTAGTPAATIQRLNAEMAKILAMPEIQQKIVELGGEVKADSPESFSKWLKSNMDSWSKIIKENGIKLN